MNLRRETSLGVSPSILSFEASIHAKIMQVGFQEPAAEYNGLISPRAASKSK
jgi:hypothetical protein